jgi:predicted transcriptional regulator
MATREESEVNERKRKYTREISLRELELPSINDTEREIAWICQCLGLADGEDDLALDIFKELLHATKKQRGISSKEITEKKHVTQAAVVYHLNIFMRTGLIEKRGRRYFLRSSRLDETLDELEQYMLRRMRRIKEIAKRIDDALSGIEC